MNGLPAGHRWSSPNTLTVAFGSGATLVPGDRVRLSAGAGGSVRSFNAISGTMVTLDPEPETRNQPQTLKTLPSTLNQVMSGHKS